MTADCRLAIADSRSADCRLPIDGLSIGGCTADCGLRIGARGAIAHHQSPIVNQSAMANPQSNRQSAIRQSPIVNRQSVNLQSAIFNRQ
jgi:hypothetical protein